ncbi:uncharacterized protein LOC126830993 [Patella vulgata]|uniref:uncharacterized protein LOC126830993 n=1 Tax=Patella vulgata TaxID=6465 RepID=UPI0021806B4E|nr:uncharacterized protein LOC126830993 [Patella vulgata]
MHFRGYCALLVVVAVTFANLSESVTVLELDKEASKYTSFKEAWKQSATMYKDLPAACAKYKNVIDQAEMRIIIAYTTDTAFHSELNEYVRTGTTTKARKFPKAKAALSKALKKLGDYQRNHKTSRHTGKLYRAESYDDVYKTYNKGKGKLVQFTSTSIYKNVAEKYRDDRRLDYLTTFKNPPAGAYIGDCSAIPPEYEFLLPFGLEYTPEEVKDETAILNLQKNVATTIAIPRLKRKPAKTKCFPAKTELLTRNGVKYIEDIEIGDEVQVISPDGSVGYSEVWCHGHYDLNSTNSYLEITTQTHVLPISHRHYLPVAVNSTFIYKMAQDVKVGDFLVTVDGDGQLLEMVQYVKEIERTGAFSPLTKSGHVLINGIQASCYSEVYPTTAHAGLTPFRVAYDVTPRAIMDLILAPNSNGVPYIFDAVLNTMGPFIVQGSAGTMETNGLPNLFRPFVHTIS